MPTPVVGQSATMTRQMTDEDVRAFAALTGDVNPLHLDEEYAATTRFGRRVAHGLLGASLIGAVIGTRLPGSGAIYLQQTLDFLAPIFIGDVVTATVEVVTVRLDKPIVTLRTTCTNDRGERVIDGQAVLLAPSPMQEKLKNL